jgi:TetR/AcrR family transcriptional repressor of lmrAB and yxaGH operons
MMSVIDQMPRASDARQKMIVSQVLLQRERGVAGTALPDVLAHSGAPRGSIYHHFPQGRAQLAEEATAWASDMVGRRLESLLADGNVLAALDAFVADWRDVLAGSDYAAGCPVAAGAVDATTRRAAAAGFRRWELLLSGALIANGVRAARAESLALTVIAAVEGAILMARAEGAPRPLDRAAAHLRTLLEDELRQAAATSPR